jgi:hypothetical protein
MDDDEERRICSLFLFFTNKVKHAVSVSVFLSVP